MVQAPKIREKLRSTIQKFRLFTPGERVVVAVSGGADSVAMLSLLTELQAELDLQLSVAHLNHGLRTEASEEDARFVQRFAESLSLPCFVERGDVAGTQRRGKISMQVAARMVRHEMLARIAKEQNATKIALGHTKDDLTETVLMRILRGTGLDGLRGFGAADFPRVRPLYEISRAETHAYCAELGLPYRTDLSNDDPHYTRNRVRTELLPYLAAYYNERVGDAILRMANLAEADNYLLEELALASFDRLAEVCSNSLSMSASELKAEPLALRRRIVRQAILKIRESLADIGADEIESVIEALELDQRITLELPRSPEGKTYRITVGERMTVELKPSDTLPTKESEAKAWNLTLQPGENRLPNGDRLSLYRETAATALAKPEQGESILFRADNVQEPLVASSRRPGDFLRPRGLNGSKKLQDIFVDAKIPREQRLDKTVVREGFSQSEVLWVPGIALSERAVLWREVSLLPPEIPLLVLSYQKVK